MIVFCTFVLNPYRIFSIHSIWNVFLTELLSFLRVILMDENEDHIKKIKIDHLIKVFGPKSLRIIPLLKKGLSKDEIFEKTEHIVALNDVSFEVCEGEIFVIMGLSGCGKSTLLRCINRIVEPTAGIVSVGDVNVTGLNPDELREIRRHKIGMVFQNFALLPHRNVRENVAFGLEVQGMATDERLEKAEKTLQLVGLDYYGDSMPDQLSGGMKQRVGLARALASGAEILLMDEAFSALDPMIRRDLQDELVDINEKLNRTIIFVTHDLDEALKLGDHIALMNEGEVVQIGTPEEILTNPKNEFVERFVADVDVSKVLTANEVMKKPEPLLPITAGPHVALRLMKEYGISSIFVAARNRRLMGLVVVDDALEAVRSHKTLEEILIKDLPSFRVDTPVSEIIPMIADSRYPCAVVNEEGRIEGIIVRGSVLAALGRSGVDVFEA